MVHIHGKRCSDTGIPSFMPHSCYHQHEEAEPHSCYQQQWEAVSFMLPTTMRSRASFMTHSCYQQQWEAEPHSWLIHATNNNEKQSLIHDSFMLPTTMRSCLIHDSFMLPATVRSTHSCIQTTVRSTPTCSSISGMPVTCSSLQWFNEERGTTPQIKTTHFPVMWRGGGGGGGAFRWKAWGVSYSNCK